MPKRKIPLVNQEIYHVFNRSVAKQPIFHNKKENETFLSLLEYYRFPNPPLRFSHYQRLNTQDKTKLLRGLYKKNKHLVEIYSFSIMPNHYHLLLKQSLNSGIMNFIRLIQNSYARFLNLRYKRSGSLFQSPFKAVRLETDEQFIHVARYIHLNPLTSFVIRDFNDLKSYQWNSYLDYLSFTLRKFINTSFLMNYFKNIEKFEEFTKDNLDYQRKLEKLKHLIIE